MVCARVVVCIINLDSTHHVGRLYVKIFTIKFYFSDNSDTHEVT